MIHKAKDLSPDQKMAIESLLGRSVAEDEAISIRAIASASAPGWLQESWESAKRLAWIDSPWKRSMRKSMLHARRGVIASRPWSNDPDCSRYQCPDFGSTQFTRTARTLTWIIHECEVSS
jgi:hypothetical protein